MVGWKIHKFSIGDTSSNVFFLFFHCHVPSLKLTANPPLKIGRLPQKERIVSSPKNHCSRIFSPSIGPKYPIFNRKSLLLLVAQKSGRTAKWWNNVQKKKQSSMDTIFFHQDCWWLKSCTTWDVWNPINNGKKLPINWCRIFQPSTVSIHFFPLLYLYYIPNGIS